MTISKKGNRNYTDLGNKVSDLREKPKGVATEGVKDITSAIDDEPSKVEQRRTEQKMSVRKRSNC